MGFLSDLFDAIDTTLGVKTESESEREVRIEGRESDPHQHSDGSYGTDTYAAKVIYENGEKVHESNAGWGHISNGSDKSDHVK